VIEPVGHSGLSFLPGQVAWLTIRTSPFSIREHPFSFSCSAEHPEQLAFAIRELGDMTATIKDLAPGEPVYVDGPYGTFDIDQHQASGYVFLAGGIGSAPIMSMLCSMADRGDERPLYLFYGNRTLEDVTFYEQLEGLEDALNLNLVYVLEKPPEGWTGETGYMNAEMLARHLPEEREGWVCFVCGPLPMIDAVEHALAEIGFKPSQIYSEQYEMA
jgi:predicted ferric reductase